MRRVKYLDNDGFWHTAFVRDDDSDEAAQESGVPSGPPDLNALDWQAIRRELNNELFARGLLTYADVTSAQSGVSAAVRKVITKKIITLYKEM